MTVTLTYDDVLSRVRITGSGLSATADEATVERSLDQVTWTVVRGAEELPVVSQRVTVDDYEFSDGVVNYYRVTAYEASPSSFVAAGTTSIADNGGTVAPALPAGIQTGDLLLIQASIRNSPAGTPNTPTGYTLIHNMTNMRIFGKIATSSESGPSVSFSGGVAGADTLGRMCAFRNTALVPDFTDQVLNTSAQDIIRPAQIDPSEDDMVILLTLWKQDDWSTASSGPAGYTAIGDTISTLGNDAAQGWSYNIQTAKTLVNFTSSTVTGGAAAISRAGVLSLFQQDLQTNQETNSITPVLDSVWLKVITRPFLNRKITCVNDASDIKREARNGIFPVIGRSYPIAITDLRGSRQFLLTVTTETEVEWRGLDLVLSGGDVIFLHTPTSSVIETMYAVIGDTAMARPLRSRNCNFDFRKFELPLIEIAKPDVSVVGSIGTWQTVIDTYATWNDVIADNVDWAELLTLIGSPGEIIVP